MAPIATELATAYITLIPSFKGGTAKIERDLGSVGAGAGKRAGRGFSSAFGKTVSLAVPLLAGAAILKQAKDVFAAAAESRKIAALTEQVIKTTGGAAKLTADQVADLAGALAKKTGVDDEVIQSGANLLLTFTKVRDEAGKGNDVFSRATGLANDMSVALGTDMKSASLQLGKALNDPVKGLTVLTKAGVAFTQEQKDQVKAMVASGDVLGAQKIILDEVGVQFGGAAKAAATPLDKLKVIAGDLQERLGEKLLPIVGRLAEALARNLPGAIAKIGDLFERVKPTLTTIVDTLRSFAERVKPVAAAVARFIKEDPVPFFAGLGVVLGGVVLVAVNSLVVSLAALLSPVVLVIAAMALLTAGFLYAYRNFEGFRVVVDAVINGVRAKIEEFVEAVRVVWAIFGDTIMVYVGAVWSFIQRTISNALNIVRGVIMTVLALLSGDWGKAWDAMKGVLSAIWDQIINVITLAIATLKAIVSAGFDLLKELLAAPIRDAKDTVVTVFDNITALFSDLPGKLADGLSSLAETIAAPFQAMGQAIKDAWNNSVGGKGFDIPDLPGVPGAGTRVEIPRLHSGGLVTGRPGQEVLRLLEAGEMVVSRGDVAKMAAGGGGAVPGAGYSIGRLEVTTVANANADEVVASINAKLGWAHTTRRDR